MRSKLARVTQVVVLSLALFLSTGANADPYTEHLDPLIDELAARSAALEGATDKAEQKRKKTLDQLLKGFAKDAKGPDKDLKAVGKAAKKLAKVYPEEFSPGLQPAGPVVLSLPNLIEQALDLFGGDVDSLLDAAQGAVNGAPPGKCQDKAQQVLDQGEALLDGADLAGDPASKAKALAKALKTALKAQGAADKALGCVPKLEWYIDIGTVDVDGDLRSLFDEANDNEDDELGSTYLPGPGSLFIFLFSADGEVQLSFSVGVGDDPKGLHSVVASLVYLNQIYNLSGEVNITKVPSSLPGHFHGNFDLAGGGRDVTGSFAIYTYDDSPP